jgi:hypothetical protein
MTSSSSEPPPGLMRGEAYDKCLEELQPPHPDYAAAQVYALLSLDETLRRIARQLEGLAEQVGRIAPRKPERFDG